MESHRLNVDQTVVVTSNIVLLPKNLAGKKRDAIITHMEKRGIQCGSYFSAIHLQPFYKKEFGYKKGDYPTTEDISSRTLALPFFNAMTHSQVREVAKSLKEIITAIHVI